MGDVLEFRLRNAEKAGRGTAGKQLRVDHKRGRIAGDPRKGDPVADFGSRLARIRASLEKINRLMDELKRMSAAEPERSRALEEST
jgi:hypothetical protein